MIPFLDKLFRGGGAIATALARFRKGTELIFLSKREKTKRVSERFETSKRKEMETERLDRLRHPSNYQGR